MRRILFLLTLLPSIAVAQLHNPAMETVVGFEEGIDYAGTTTSTYLLDAADGGDADTCSDDIMSFGIFTTTAKTLDKFRVFAASKTGTIGTNDLTASLYLGSAGVPTGSVITSCDTITTAAGTNMYLEWTCFNDSLTANTQYLVVVKNCNATPASNYVTLNRSAAIGPKVSDYRHGTLADRCSADGGTVWTNCDDSASAFAVIEFTDGTSIGNPYSQYSGPSGGSATYRAYDTREVGIHFTTPADAKLNAIGGACVGAKNGTPTGAYRLKLYQGTTLLATGSSIPAADVTTNSGWLKSYWTKTEIPANTTMRMVASAATGGDTSANSWGLGIWQIENDPESLALRPLGMKFTVYDGSNWTETETVAPICYLILDNGDYFGTQSSGGLLNHNNVSGGAQ